MTREEILDLDDFIMSEKLPSPLVQLHRGAIGCPFKKTMAALVSLSDAASFLKTGVFTSTDNEDPYSAGILVRSIIEHFLLHSLVFFQFIERRNDTPGEDFAALADIKETIEFSRALGKSLKMFRGIEQPKNLKEAVFKQYPKYESLTTKEFEQKAAEYSVTNMIRFLWSFLKTDDAAPKLVESLPLDYSDLSLRVHGGPYASKLMLWWSTHEQEKQAELQALCMKAFFFSTTMVMQTFIAASQYDGAFEPVIAGLKGILQNVTIETPEQNQSKPGHA